VNVNQGASQVFTIAPSAGYAVSAVTVDGASVGAVCRQERCSYYERH
jgi:hypothetical protein